MYCCLLCNKQYSASSWLPRPRYLVAGGEIRDIPDHDVDQHLDVVGVEEIRGGLAAQQIHEELEERVRGLRLVLEDPDGIVCKPIVVVSLRTSTRRYSRSRFSSSRIFSVKVLATSRSSSAFNTGLSELSWNCRLKEMMQLRNRSGICSSMSVSGGYSTLLRRNDKKLPPRSSASSRLDRIGAGRRVTVVGDGHGLPHREYHREQDRGVV
jgi:hypothetical protein